jgi:PIN domain nuclease of toxin-antitoxin system
LKVLLDTHAFIWWINEPGRLSARASSILADTANEALLSAVVAWELSVKHAKGRLDLPDSPEIILRFALGEGGFAPLSIVVSHALEVGDLPPHHSDPFDRLLVAQALVEHLPILTSDVKIARYDVETVW